MPARLPASAVRAGAGRRAAWRNHSANCCRVWRGAQQHDSITSSCSCLARRNGRVIADGASARAGGPRPQPRVPFAVAMATPPRRPPAVSLRIQEVGNGANRIHLVCHELSGLLGRGRMPICKDCKSQQASPSFFCRCLLSFTCAVCTVAMPGRGRRGPLVTRALQIMGPISS